MKIRVIGRPHLDRLRMQIKLLGVIAAVFVFNASLPSFARAQSNFTKIAPDALIANLYRAQTKVFQPRSRTLLDKYFEKKLADLIWKELLRWQSSGDSDVEDFDYVLYNFGYGEGTVTKFAVGKPTYQDRKAQVNVSYDVVYAPPAVAKRSVSKENIIFLLTEGETGWRISDLKYDGGTKSLVEIYSKDSKERRQ